MNLEVNLLELYPYAWHLYDKEKLVLGFAFERHAGGRSL